MPDEFFFCISGCPKRSDNARFLADGVADGDSKDKRHDDDNDIEKNDYHCPVAAHIVAGEFDGLVLISRDKSFQGNLFAESLHELIGEFFLLPFGFRCFIVLPGIAVL